MRETSFLEIYPSSFSSREDIMTMVLLNVRSLVKHTLDIISDSVLNSVDSLFFTETQLTSEPSEILKQNFEPFELSANNTSQHKYSNLALAYRRPLSLLQTESFPGISIYALSKPCFSFNLNVMLIYRQQTMSHENFLYTIQHVRDQFDKTIHIIMGDLNVDSIENPDNFVSRFLVDYRLINTEPTHISGSLIDHVYIHETLGRVCDVITEVHKVYFSDHDAVMIRLKALNNN